MNIGITLFAIALSICSSLSAWNIRYCDWQQTTPLYLYTLDATSKPANGSPEKPIPLNHNGTLSNTSYKGPYSVWMSSSPSAFTQGGATQSFALDNYANVYIIPCSNRSDGFNVVSSGCDVTQSNNDCTVTNWCLQAATPYSYATVSPKGLYCLSSNGKDEFTAQYSIPIFPTIIDNTGYPQVVTIGGSQQGQPNFNVMTSGGQTLEYFSQRLAPGGMAWLFAPVSQPKQQIKVTQNPMGASVYYPYMATIQDSTFVNLKPNTIYAVTVITGTTGQKQFVIKPLITP